MRNTLYYHTHPALAVVGTLILFWSTPAYAEQSGSQLSEASQQIDEANPSVQRDRERLEQLEEQLRQVGGQLEEISRGTDQHDDVVERLEQRISTQEQRIAELEAEGAAEDAREEEERDNPVVQWTRGRGLEMRPWNNDTFVFGLRGFLWARYDAVFRVQDGDPSLILNNFSIPETRLRFMATFADGLFHFVIQPSLVYGRAGIQDGYFEIRLHQAATIRFGQQLVPFDWEGNTSPPRLPLNGLGPLAARFGHGRDLGVMLMGTVASRLHYRVGAFNGSGRAFQINDNNSLLIAAMLRIQALGSMNAGWGWSDIGHVERPALAFRLGFTYDRDESTREVEDGSDLDPEFTMTSLQGTADMLLRWRGAALATVYYFGADRQEDLDLWTYSHGWLVHAGYFVWRERLELLFRYTGHYQPVEYTYLRPAQDGEEDVIGMQFDAGMTFFLLGHHARITALYKYRRDMPNLPEGSHDHALQIELRGWF